MGKILERETADRVRAELDKARDPAAQGTPATDAIVRALEMLIEAIELMHREPGR